MKDFPIDKIRQDFPILQEKVHGNPLIYLDNAATTQKPNVVIQTIKENYEKNNSNIHRGVHYLSSLMTEKHEAVREKTRKFINAEHSHEIVFTRGTTESVNLVASSYGDAFLREGDEIIVTGMEHHSNFVPWQILCQGKKMHLRIAPVNADGSLDMKALEELMNEKTGLLAITHVSNVLGTVNPIKEIVKSAHARDIPVLVDGAQAIQHVKVDVQDLDCDFYCFSAHKMYGPTGIGVLYGKEELLEKMPPYQSGGEMISSVSDSKTVFNDLPFKFEAGTPNYIACTGMGAAVDYLNKIDLKKIAEYENELIQYADDVLKDVKGMQYIGTSECRSSVRSFNIQGAHPYDIGTLLDNFGIAVRTGHHCAEPLMRHYEIQGTVRASFSLYNTIEEIDSLKYALEKVIKIFHL